MSAKKSTSKSRRPVRVQKSRAGGQWGDAFRARLALLIRAKADGNQARFAALCGLHATRVSGWLAGKVLPKLDTIGAIARATGVSVDWLLEGKGHDETPSAEPIYRGQWRTEPRIEADVAEYVRTELARDNQHVTTLAFRGRALLHVTVNAAREDVAEWTAWFRNNYSPLFAGANLVANELDVQVGEARSLCWCATEAEIEKKLERISALALELTLLIHVIEPLYRAPRYFDMTDGWNVNPDAVTPAASLRRLLARDVPGHVSTWRVEPDPERKRYLLDGQEIVPVGVQWLPPMPRIMANTVMTRGFGAERVGGYSRIGGPGPSYKPPPIKPRSGMGTRAERV